jgi:hypothetical protein
MFTKALLSVVLAALVVGGCYAAPANIVRTVPATAVNVSFGAVDRSAFIRTHHFPLATVARCYWCRPIFAWPRSAEIEASVPTAGVNVSLGAVDQRSAVIRTHHSLLATVARCFWCRPHVRVAPQRWS